MPPRSYAEYLSVVKFIDRKTKSQPRYWKDVLSAWLKWNANAQK
jgi:hypothetical protein